MKLMKLKKKVLNLYIINIFRYQRIRILREFFNIELFRYIKLLNSGISRKRASTRKD